MESLQITEGDEAHTTPDQVNSKKKRKNHCGGQKKKNKWKKEGKGDERSDATSLKKGISQGIGPSVLKEPKETLLTLVVEQIFEIRATEGKGQRVFATKDISRGTRIMSEEPFIICKKIWDLSDVISQFEGLSPDSRRRVFELHCNRKDDRDTARKKMFESRPASLVLSVEDQVTILAIYETNCFFISVSSSGLFATASRMNHSCVPNVHHCWNESLNHQTVHTVRDIKAGEEIFTAYIRLCRGRQARQNELSRFGFACNCPACDLSTDFGEASMGRREWIFFLEFNLAMYRNRHTASSLISDDQYALRAMLEIVGLLKEEGLVDMELTVK